MGFLVNSFIEFPQPTFNLNELLFYYKFNALDSGLINQAAAVGSTDEIANSLGTVTGASLVTGLIGNAYDFDGTNDKVEMANSLATWNPFHNGILDWTINFWLKFNVADSGALQVIIGNNGFSASIGFTISMDDRDASRDNRLRVHIGNGSSAIDWDSAVGDQFFANDTNWHMYTIQYTVLTQTLNAYRDAANNINGDFTFTESTSNAAQLLNIGTKADDDDFDLNADMDEACGFSRLLTTDELTELYNSGSGLEL